MAAKVRLPGIGELAVPDIYPSLAVSALCVRNDRDQRFGEAGARNSLRRRSRYKG